MTDKQMVLTTLAALPESATWEQIQEEFEVIAAIKEGQAAVEAGEVIAHEEVEKLVESWTTK